MVYYKCFKGSWREIGSTQLLRLSRVWGKCVREARKFCCFHFSKLMEITVWIKCCQCQFHEVELCATYLKNCKRCSYRPRAKQWPRSLQYILPKFANNFTQMYFPYCRHFVINKQDYPGAWSVVISSWTLGARPGTDWAKIGGCFKGHNHSNCL